jgi:hypothetical protein
MTRTLAMTAAVVVALGATARADKESASDEQLVLVNAASKLGDFGQITRLKRVLDAHNMLHKLPDSLEKTLEGRDVALADVDTIREAFQTNDFETALKIIDEDERRVLDNVAGGDPIPALAQLAEWRGLIAAGTGQTEEAVSRGGLIPRGTSRSVTRRRPCARS